MILSCDILEDFLEQIHSITQLLVLLNRDKDAHSRKLCTHSDTHTHTQAIWRGTLTILRHLVVAAGSKRNRGAERAKSTTSRYYTHIAAWLPEERTRPTGLVNLKARMEGGGLAVPCQEEAAGTSRLGRGETARVGKRGRQKAERV